MTLEKVSRRLVDHGTVHSVAAMGGSTSGEEETSPPLE